MLLVLLIRVELFGVMNQVLMAVHTLLFITGSGINYRSMSQHGSTFVRNIEKVAVAFLTLFVPKGSIGFIAILVMIVSLLGKMNDNVFNAMESLGVEEVKRIVGGRQVTVHAVGYKTLGVVDVGGGLPCVIGILDLMAPRTELRRGRTYHGVVTEAEKGEGYKKPYGDEDGRFDQLFHVPLLISRVMVRKQPLDLCKSGPWSLLWSVL
jgi:hypothetical protein